MKGILYSDWHDRPISMWTDMTKWGYFVRFLLFPILPFPSFPPYPTFLFISFPILHFIALPYSLWGLAHHYHTKSWTRKRKRIQLERNQPILNIKLEEITKKRKLIPRCIEWKMREWVDEGMNERRMEGKSDVLCDGSKGQRKREEKQCRKERQNGKEEKKSRK